MCVLPQMVSYLLDLPGEAEEDRPEINCPDSLWGETGTGSELKLVFIHTYFS